MSGRRLAHPFHNFTILAVLAGLLASSGFAPLPPRWQAKVDPALLALAPLEQTEFILYLSVQADLSGAAQLQTKAEKGRYVYERLRAAAQASQPPVLAALAGMGLAARPYWVANMVWVQGGAGTIRSLAQRPDVQRVYTNPQVRFQEPQQGSPSALQTTQAAAGVEWNLQKVGAPLAWSAGYTGQGAVVAGQDTGYDWDHPALKGKYRGWNGTSADHNYNWHDAIHSNGAADCPANSTQPCDDNGHGTHTMGTMVGDDGAENQVGMAPGARWIGCRNMNQGVGTPVTYAECYQWFLAPTDLSGQNARPDLAPDVINNSWGCPWYEGCTQPDVLLQVVDNVRAAGILTVHSAGNEGSSCSSVSTPAAIYDSSFTVGNTTRDDAIAGSSSRGPVTVDGSGRIKPDISAPGTNIRSGTRNGGYTTLSGTSMAGPHVAGLVALLISANPALAGQVDALETLIKQTAVPLTSAESCGKTAGQVPNNTFGYGRIDAANAVLGQLQVRKQAPAVIRAGDVMTYTLTVTHTQAAAPLTGVVLTDTLPANTALIAATQPFTQTENTIRWDFSSLAEGESRSVQLAVQVLPEASGVIRNQAYGARSGQRPETVAGPPVETRAQNDYAISLAPDHTGWQVPGASLVYTHTLTNTGLQPDSYSFTLTSSRDWAALAPAAPVALDPGESAILTVTISIPPGTGLAEIDTTRLEVQSEHEPLISSANIDTTTVIGRTWFPLFFKP